jgi:hypothetical protein
MTDAEFIAALEPGTLPEAEFGHAGHVRAARLCLRQGSFPDALARMSVTLRTYAAAHGKPDRYHETATVAFLALINERLHTGGDGGDWRAFLDRNRELCDKRLLTHYSTTARRPWHRPRLAASSSWTSSGRNPTGVDGLSARCVTRPRR